MTAAGPIEEAMWCMGMHDAMVGAALSSHKAIVSAVIVARLVKTMHARVAVLL